MLDYLVRILLILAELLWQILCLLLTGHNFEFYSMRRIRYADPHEGIRAGDWMLVERCSYCGCCKLTIWR